MENVVGCKTLREIMAHLAGPGGGVTSLGKWLSVQLRIAESLSSTDSLSAHSSTGATEGDSPAEVPPIWELTKGIDLWDWQKECAERWLALGRRGIAKVVTGAGKTVLAQHIIERLHNEVDRELRVAIVVPTIVLMHQWVDSLLRHSNLPAESIGCLGGGRKDTFSQNTRILVTVLNSAARWLPAKVEQAGIGAHLLLIVDECHRTTGPSMSRIFRTPRAHTLGLSATPEEDNPRAPESASVDSKTRLAGSDLTQALGPIVYELTVGEAVEKGILARFEIRHYGVSLVPDERQKYESISREIRQLSQNLRVAGMSRQARTEDSVLRLAQRLLNKNDHPLHETAIRYIEAVRVRKRLLYGARARVDVVLWIIDQSLAVNPASRILVFHESIEEVNRLYQILLQAGYRVTLEHSRLPDSLRAESIRLFRGGDANVLVSARALIEGFDMPTVDVGIVAASSSSVRQRIQTIGRVLRRPRQDQKKTATIHCVYVSQTVDERIYEKVRWDSVIGAERNLYYSCIVKPDTPEIASDVPRIELIEQPEPPRKPLPTELDIDWNSLHVGDPYPGKFEGDYYRYDEQGNVFDAQDRLVDIPQEILDRLATFGTRTRTFKVTRQKHAVLFWDRASHCAKFLGLLAKRPCLRTGAVNRVRKKQGDTEELGATIYVKQFRGARRLQNSEKKFAKLGDQAQDPEKGEDAVALLKAIGDLERVLGVPIRNVTLLGKDVFCLVRGQRQHVYTLKKGLEFHE